MRKSISVTIEAITGVMPVVIRVIHVSSSRLCSADGKYTAQSLQGSILRLPRLDIDLRFEDL